LAEDMITIYCLHTSLNAQKVPCEVLTQTIFFVCWSL